jgi:hypothetical protein
LFRLVASYIIDGFTLRTNCSDQYSQVLDHQLVLKDLEKMVMNVKLIRYQFRCTRCAFQQLTCMSSDAHAQKAGNPKSSYS